MNGSELVKSGCRPGWAAGMVLLGLLLPSAAGAQDAGLFPRLNRPVAPAVSPVWESEALRDRNREAGQVFDWLQLHAGDRVADIGTGSGYYATRLARLLGPTAIIYAEDIHPGYLAELEARLLREGLTNVRVVQGTRGDPALTQASVDVAILGHMYHEIANPYEFFYRLYPALSPGARVAVIEANRNIERHGIPPDAVRCELHALGYRELFFTPLLPGESYLLVFSPPKRLPEIDTIEPCGYGH